MLKQKKEMSLQLVLHGILTQIQPSQQENQNPLLQRGECPLIHEDKSVTQVIGQLLPRRGDMAPKFLDSRNSLCVNGGL